MAQTWPISESASKRCSPKYISAKSTPADQMSIALVYFPEENRSSGARYALLGEQGSVSVKNECESIEACLDIIYRVDLHTLCRPQR